MNLVVAIIKPFKLDEVREALTSLEHAKPSSHPHNEEPVYEERQGVKNESGFR